MIALRAGRWRDTFPKLRFADLLGGTRGGRGRGREAEGEEEEEEEEEEEVMEVVEEEVVEVMEEEEVEVAVDEEGGEVVGVDEFALRDRVLGGEEKA